MVLGSTATSRFLVVISILFTAMSVFAAPELDLNSVLAKLPQAPKVLKAQSAKEEASWKRVESYSGFLPSVTETGSRLFDKKYVFTDINFGGANTSVPGIVPTTSYALNMQWTLFDGFANVDRYQAASLGEKASESELDWTQFKTEHEVILLFYHALADATLKNVAEQNLKTLRDHLEDVKLFKRAGVSTNYDVLRVEVQVSEAESEILNSADNAEVSGRRLAEALGEEPESFTVKGQIPVLSSDILAGKSAGALNRKDLEALTNRLASLEKLESATFTHWFPRISLYGQIQNYNNIDDSWNKSFRDAYYLGLQFTWSIFNGFADHAKDREALEQKNQAALSLRQAQLQSKTDVEFWKRKFMYFTTVFKARQSDISKASESVRLAREGRKAGVRTTTDLLDAELELFRARAASVNAQVGAVDALVNYELATGQKLYNFN